VPQPRRTNQRRAAKTAGYNSGFEHTVASYLEKKGVPFEYELHSFGWEEHLPTAHCRTCDTKACYKKRSYTPDFFVGNPNSPIIIETKGIFTVHDRKIALAMKEQHPDVDLRYLFLRDNKLSRKSKTRYSEWCQKNGLTYGISTDLQTTLSQWVDDLV
jgi:hypothetical protein